MKEKKLSEVPSLPSIDIDGYIVVVNQDEVGKIQINECIKSMAPIGFNLLIGSGVNASKNAGDGKTEIVTRTSFYPLIKDVLYTLSFNGTNWGGGSIGLKVGNATVNASILSGNDLTRIVVFKCPVDSNSITFTHTGSDAGNSHIRWSCLYQGVVNPPSIYKKSLGDL